MKKYWLFSLLVAFVSIVGLSSCAPKYGCPANESLKPKTDKKGELLGGKRKKTDLFPKNMKKKM